MGKKAKENCLLIFVIVISFIGVLILNLYTPLIADDFHLSYIHNSSQLISNFGDLMKSAFSLYQNWTGRTVAHFMNQMFLMGNKIIFNLINSTAYVLLVYVVCKHVVGRGRVSPLLFASAALIQWLFIPLFGQTVLWLTGSANYMLPTLIIMLYLLFFRFQFESATAYNQNFKNIYISVFGFFAAWTSENTAGAMIVLIVFFIVFCFFKKQFIPQWAYLGLLSSLVGFLVMLLAPGNRARLASLPVNQNQGIVGKYVERIRNMISLALQYMVPLIVLTIICIILFFVFRMYKNNIMYLAFVYGIGGVLAIGATVLSPALPVRTWFGGSIFIFISILFVVKNLIEKISIKRYLSGSLLIVLMLIPLPSYMHAFADIYKTFQVASYRDIEVELQKKKGVNMVELPSYTAKNTYNAAYQLDDIGSDEENPVNRYIAKYYGISKVRGYLPGQLELKSGEGNFSHLPELEPIGQAYYGMFIDYKNWQPLEQQGQIVLSKDEKTIDLRGWAVDFMVNKPLSGMYVIIGNREFMVDYGMESPDLAKVYKNELLSKCYFSFSFSVSLLQEQNVDEINFIMVGNDGTYRFMPVKYSVIQQ